MTAAPLLAVSGLHITFPGGVRAVRGADFSLTPGEVLAVVGESGAGKSATALAVTGLLPAAHVEGSVRLRGRELLGLGDKELAAIRGNDIAMICQDQAFTPVYRIGTQIAETVRLHSRVPRRTATERAIQLLRLAGIPDAHRVARAFPHELSGGLRRRAMIAMAAAGDPAVIVADEPTAGLDPPVQTNVLDALQAHQSRTGAALLLITHDLGVVAARADRVLVMYAGRPVETGPVDEVLTRPQMPYTTALLNSVPRLDRPHVRSSPITGPPLSVTDAHQGCPFEPRCPIPAEECRTSEPPLRPVGTADHHAACLRAHEISTHVPTGTYGRSLLTQAGDAVKTPPGAPRVVAVSPSDDASRSGGVLSVSPLGGRAHTRAEAGVVAGLPSEGRTRRPVVLEVDGLAKHYPLHEGRLVRRRSGEVRAVDGVRFDIRAGETLGLVGESGCGKTTVLMEILRLGATQGRVVVFGRDTATLSAAERRRLRRDLQIVFQDPLAALDPRMTVGAILAEPLRAHRRRDIRTRVPELLRLTGLESAHAARRPGELSGGQRQRVGIARALALEPKLLLMDEPFSALDVSVQAGIIALLRELKTRLGLSYLLAAHDLAAVRQLADRVAVMRCGRIAEIGDADALYETPAHPYTQALLAAVPLPDPRRERARQRITVPRGDGQPDPRRERARRRITVPSEQGQPGGCRFRAGCPAFAALAAHDRRRCADEEPALRLVRPGQAVACHFPLRSAP
jgi:peptide/nickel transport system ATP-binding protein